ncbi:MFS transporter [Sneathiella chinensis]|uniref:MFS transporter n=1 Tax=Sneathiella chinensis TaxID=349750 RepID=A0ABQ5U8G1_9PROT|nr:MFS transporter [Sneathiella chinensis]
MVAGILLAVFAETITATTLSIARLDMPGDLAATSDEYARLNMGYLATKMIFFLVTPWLMNRFSAKICLRSATGMMTLTCGLAALTPNLDIQVLLRIFQGMAGGIILVGGQTVLLKMFHKSGQPAIQAVFAMAAVVSPTALAPSLQGWLVDTLSWSWVFLFLVPLGLVALFLLAVSEIDDDTGATGSGVDWVGISAASVFLVCLTYILTRGHRWDWLDAPHVLHLTFLGVASFALFVIHQIRSQNSNALINLEVFRSPDFTFGFLASFVAGFALFGSAFAIPSFALSVLKMTATEAGLLLLPSSITFVIGLFLTAFAVRWAKLPPPITVPFGILIFMSAMWLLSGANGESGTHDLLSAILLRGLGLGFLFLSITLTTLVGLQSQIAAYGVGLFNLGRQIGGLFGVAFLETLLHNQTMLNKSILGAHIASGRASVSEQLQSLTALLAGRGLEQTAAMQTAITTLGQKVGYQASVIAYDTAFQSITVSLLIAAPLLVASKIVISKTMPPYPPDEPSR